MVYYGLLLERFFSLPKEINYLFPKYLKKRSPLASLKLSSPISGIVELQNNKLIIDRKIVIDLTTFSKNIQNCKFKFSPLIKNYQYIDKGTIIGYIEVYPTVEGRYYSIKEKYQKILRHFF